MANFVLVYTGGGMAATDAERGKMMEAWGAWFGSLGDKVVDGGNPFGPQAKNVSEGGAVHDGAIGTPATATRSSRRTRSVRRSTSPRPARWCTPAARSRSTKSTRQCSQGRDRKSGPALFSTPRSPGR